MTRYQSGAVAQAESFGRYELIKLVGAGGMALVHLARQRGPEGFVKPCVLKRIAPDAGRHESVRRMFIEEARVSALLNHPNIVQTFDYGSVDGSPYMALELIDGVNLAQFCRTLAQKKRWLPVRPAIDICLKVLDALQYAHDLVDLDGRPLRIVHRDVSPQNVLLSRQGVVKLADFGIARHEARESHTQVGDTAKGKPGYMAPEQAMGDSVDGRADLFSVGILMTELISARRVMANNERPVGVLGISERIRSLFAYRPEAPAALQGLAQRLCALDPNHRPPTAAQAAAELRHAVANQPITQPLEQFLKQVFVQHIPGDTLGAALNPATAESPSPPVPTQSRPEPPHSAAAGLGFGRDPTQGHLPSSPAEPAEAAENEVRTAWARPDQAVQNAGTGHVYEGWPKEFLPENEPRLEFVSRSATMDAMKYFAAEESENVKKGRVENFPPPGPQGPAPGQPPRGFHPPVPGAPVDPLLGDPVHDPALNRVLQGLQGPDGGLAPPRGRSRRRRRKKAEIPPVVPLAIAGLAVVVTGMFITSLISGDDAPSDTPVAPETGTLTVTSDPPNARIYIDRRDIGATTPKTLEGLAVDRPLRVSVELPDHRSTPRDIVLRIPVQTGRTSAHFTLKPGRVFTLRTVPDGAFVTVDGERMARVTPLKLEPIPFGETATVTLEHEGFLPSKLILAVNDDAETVIETKLEPAIQVDVLSEPPGALVKVDTLERGRTPLYEVLVPKGRRFRITVKKVGYQPWTRRLRPSRLDGKPVVAELVAVPFMKLPMNGDERVEAKAIQREVKRIENDIRKLRYQLRRAQQRLERLEERPSQLIGPIADAQRNVDVVREALMKRQESLADAQSKREIFRDQLLLKAEMGN